MGNFFGVNSYLNSNFFNSMLGGTGSSGFGSLYSSLGDYSMIRSGAYRTLVKAYYAQESGDTKTTKSSSKETTEKADTTAKKGLLETKTKADALKKSADALMERGTDSLFRKVEVKDAETGKVSLQYDTDKIYNAVKKFTEDYNALIGQAGKSNNASILRKGVNMIGDMANYENALKDIGITINSDNTLSIDEKAFKEADMLDVKSMFNGSVSVAAKMYQRASDIYNLSNNAVSSNSLYNSSAGYVDSLSGTLYNGIF